MKKSGGLVTDLVYLFSMLFIVAVFVFLAMNIENTLILKDLISPVPGVTIEEWQEEFDLSAAFIAVGGAGLLAIIWYLYARFAVKIIWISSTNHRLSWSVCLVITLFSIMFAAYRLYVITAETFWLAMLFTIVNGLGTYYLCTALLAPASVKYTAPLSSGLRRW